MELDKKQVKSIIKGIIVFQIFWNSVYLQYIPLFFFKFFKIKITNKYEVFLSFFSSFVIAIIFLIMYRKDLKEYFIKFKNDFYNKTDIGLKYWGIGLILMLISNSAIIYFFNTGTANNEQAVQKMIESLPWLMFITAGIIGPFNEEIVFRKVIKDIFKNKWIAAALTFILFGGAHVISSATNYVDYLFIIPYGVLGASFMLAYYESDNLFTSISMHMLHNTLLIILAIVRIMH